VVDGNPYKDINCLLGQGDHIPLVMKAGEIYYNELTGN
jgi:imidazolonepropionase-like amidohydrolase